MFPNIYISISLIDFISYGNICCQFLLWEIVLTTNLFHELVIYGLWLGYLIRGFKSCVFFNKVMSQYVFAIFFVFPDKHLGHC